MALLVKGLQETVRLVKGLQETVRLVKGLQETGHSAAAADPAVDYRRTTSCTAPCLHAAEHRGHNQPVASALRQDTSRHTPQGT
jgi:hypothetical protein